MSSILIVDDEQSICWGLAKLGRGMGHEVVTASSAEEGLRIAEDSAPDLLLLDVRLPGMDGLTALDRFRQIIGDAPIIVVTAFGALDVAVRAVRGGAFEYLTKPFDLEEVRNAIDRALRAAPARRGAPRSAPQEAMVGETPVMQALFKRIALAAASDASIVLRGESGAGKELAARAIHDHSNRSDSNFVAVNLAALSPGVAESELFGHADGAFTGANRSRKGLLQEADGGTLFLDEVAEIPLELQVKLLRAIEQQEIHPVGADQPIKSHFRVVAATHRDLRERVKSGEFRHDLYFRLCAFEIFIPPLRDRRDDIPLLAVHFAEQISGAKLALADETLVELARRDWCGNVRELRNAIEHAAVLARTGVILPEHLPDPQPSLEGSASRCAPAIDTR